MKITSTIANVVIEFGGQKVLIIDMDAYDRESKMLLIVIGLFALIFFGVAIYGFNRLEQRADKCSAAGGIVVKTTDGWKCIDAKQLNLD